MAAHKLHHITFDWSQKKSGSEPPRLRAALAQVSLGDGIVTLASEFPFLAFETADARYCRISVTRSRKARSYRHARNDALTCRAAMPLKQRPIVEIFPVYRPSNVGRPDENLMQRKTRDPERFFQCSFDCCEYPGSRCRGAIHL